MDKVKKKSGPRPETEEPRSKYVQVRVTQTEKEEIMQCFKTPKGLRDFILKVVREEESMCEATREK